MGRLSKIKREEKRRKQRLTRRLRDELGDRLNKAWAIYKHLPQCKNWNLPVNEKRVEFGREIIGPATYDNFDSLTYEQLIRAIGHADESIDRFDSQYKRQVFIRSQINLSIVAACCLIAALYFSWS